METNCRPREYLKERGLSKRNSCTSGRPVDSGIAPPLAKRKSPRRAPRRPLTHGPCQQAERGESGQPPARLQHREQGHSRDPGLPTGERRRVRATRGSDPSARRLISGNGSGKPVEEVPRVQGNLSALPLREFVLEGFRGGVEVQALLFAVFLALYVVTVLGNVTMIVVTTLDARLHSPMYFFLRNLSLLDLCYSSTIAPNTLATFLSSSKAISFAGCATQLFFFALLVTTEGLLLAVMAYDRLVAICSPLQYPVTMCPVTCARLVLAAYCGGCLNSIVETSLTFQLPFCSSNRIDHFFCDVPPLLRLACANTALNELVMFGLCGFIIVGTTLVVLVSYGYIAVTILKMRSASGRHKLFSTCGSHLTAVSLFYGTVFVMYGQPGAVESMEQGKVVSVFYTLVIPMLNPLIYSLRNKDVKDALRRLGHSHAEDSVP
ncbi:Olfactory receptor 12 [Sciurus carolinensis]|uniref:Olfactory receptor 12 n=1 Tax=Sciurus carolinensis TaxID=30640 RepID=A0AA41MPX5_SCICA|nr:Olfactory receptor 12 [Sciurus carolinensis]